MWGGFSGVPRDRPRSLKIDLAGPPDNQGSTIPQRRDPRKGHHMTDTKRLVAALLTGTALDVSATASR